ncbi:MAG: ParA family protein [Chloroflexi bacterium]|nr:ParA family protein [Chloroflexota bacterium]
MTAKVVSIENWKGGVAKTTTAVTLAVAVAKYLARKGDGRVLIMDTDPQGSAAKALALHPGERCISNLLLERGSLAENVMSANLEADGGPSRPNLFLLPASDQLWEALRELIESVGAMKEIAKHMNSAVRAKAGLNEIPSVSDVFQSALGPLKKHFDYIFIDNPPSLGALREAIHVFADFAIVPAKMDAESVKMTALHTQQILDDQQRGINIKILAVVPTFVQPRLLLTQSLMDELEATYNRMLSPSVPLRTAVAQAPAMGGLTIFDHAPSSPAAKSYAQLAKRVLAA